MVTSYNLDLKSWLWFKEGIFTRVDLRKVVVKDKFELVI